MTAYSPVAEAAPLPAEQTRADVERKGLAYGLVVAAAGGVYFTLARGGITSGFTPADLTFLRFAVSGLLFLPVLWRLGLRDLAGIGWPRGAALLAVGGPAFAFLQTWGFEYAPLAHGAVITPAAVTIASMLLAILVLGDRLGRARALGTGMVVGGLFLMGWDGLSGPEAGTWIGDLLFVGAGLVWSGYTVLLKMWRLDALRATAVVAVLSLALVLPYYAATGGFARLSALPVEALLLQGFGQGVLAGVVLIYAFGRAIVLLGPGRAGLFPSIVPAVSILLGIPVLGEWPSVLEVAGLFIVTAGLLVAIGLAGRKRGAR